MLGKLETGNHGCYKDSHDTVVWWNQMPLLIESHVFVLVTTNNTPFLPKRTKYSAVKLQPVRTGTRLWLFHKPCAMAGIRSYCSRSRWQSRLHVSESVSFPLSTSLRGGLCPVLALCIASHPSSCVGKGKRMTLAFLAHTWKITVPPFPSLRCDGGGGDGPSAIRQATTLPT